MAFMKYRPLSTDVLWDLTGWVDPLSVTRGLGTRDLLSDGGFSPNMESYTRVMSFICVRKSLE